ncbi:hypothetical protein tinsulaeT_12240 [Thalassotalea insulae]|uniref:Solute-binding protein family 3/N-terminal domain-containing protein n=1 Tax=Thalassotalea insulae TaxID=2056778 RepID=A0ABQ6GRB1_9GAMM|nr:hypothetical protein [Thalassotalea insulae]GLX77884.1 hypothetical protein tinsulaeT_12240 [Thalassotalea insulae]
MLRRFAFFILFSMLANSLIAQEIRVVGKQAEADIAHGYFIQLISLALTASTPKYPATSFQVIDINRITQMRTLNLLAQGSVDVFWSGTNKAREAQFIPIRIPLFQGLLGYRLSIIHQDNLAMFNKLLKQPDQLKSLTACQGEHWPDSDILESNGYKVSRIVRFDSMYAMLAFKRCDYFPRAIFEGYSELEVIKKKFPKLVVFDQLILHYPFAIYFFVNKNNPELAQQLTYGLNQLINDGRLMQFMKSHPLSSPLFPLTKWQDKQYLHLSNQDLSKETRALDDKFWLKLYP